MLICHTWILWVLVLNYMYLLVHVAVFESMSREICMEDLDTV